jgi:hypothetical protein
MGLCHETEGPEFADIGVESRRQSVRLYIPAAKVGDFHKPDADKADIDTHACVEIDNDLIEPLMRCLALARLHVNPDVKSDRPAPAFVRLDWGGIETDDRGRDALADTAATLAWLEEDYSRRRDEYKAAWQRTEYAERDLAAIWRVQEMILAATGREQDARDALARVEDE